MESTVEVADDSSFNGMHNDGSNANISIIHAPTNDTGGDAMTAKHVHITATVLDSTDKALEAYCTTTHQGKTIKIPRSQVIDDALRVYLKLKPLKH